MGEKKNAVPAVLHVFAPPAGSYGVAVWGSRLSLLLCIALRCNKPTTRLMMHQPTRTHALHAGTLQLFLLYFPSKWNPGPFLFYNTACKIFFPLLIQSFVFWEGPEELVFFRPKVFKQIFNSKTSTFKIDSIFLATKIILHLTHRIHELFVVLVVSPLHFVSDGHTCAW